MDEQGRTYYWNKQLRLSQYESPFDSPPLPPPIPRMQSLSTSKPQPPAWSGQAIVSPVMVPEPSVPSSNKRRATVLEKYDMQQLLRERRRLRAMALHVEGKERLAEIMGEIAAIDSDLLMYFGDGA